MRQKPKANPPTPTIRRTITEETVSDERVNGPTAWGPPEPITVDPVDSRLDSLRKTHGSDLVVKVYRSTRDGSSYCMTFTEDDVTEEAVQAAYPEGGRFLCKVFVGGVFQYSFPLLIEPRKASAAPVASAASAVELQMKFMQEQMNLLRDLLLNRNSGPQSSVTELAGAINLLKPAPQEPMSDKFIDVFMRGMDIANKAGVGDWKSDLIGVLKEIAGPIAKTVLEQAAKQNGTHGGMAAVAGQVIETRPVSGESAMIEASDEQMRQLLPWVKQQIRMRLDPALAVEWLLQNAGDVNYGRLVNKLYRSSVDDIVKLDAEFSSEPFNAWIRKAMEFVKQAVEAQKREFETGGEDEAGSVDTENSGR